MVQSSYRRCFLAAIIRAGKQTHNYSTYEGEQQRDIYMSINVLDMNLSFRCTADSISKYSQPLSEHSRVGSNSARKNNSLTQKAELTSRLFLNHTFTTGAEMFP